MNLVDERKWQNLGGGLTMDISLLKSINASIESGQTQEFRALIEKHPDALGMMTVLVVGCILLLYSDNWKS